jgi:hypothetical protein
LIHEASHFKDVLSLNDNSFATFLRIVSGRNKIILDEKYKHKDYFDDRYYSNLKLKIGEDDLVD